MGEKVIFCSQPLVKSNDTKGWEQLNLFLGRKKDNPMLGASGQILLSSSL